MRSRLRIATRAVFVTAAAAVVTFLPAHACFAQGAGDAPSLTVATAKDRYAAGDQVSIVSTVTNRSTTRCAIAGLADGTIEVTSMTVDGSPVSPRLTYTYYYQGYGQTFQSLLKPLDPGQSLTFPIAVAAGGIVISDPSPDEEAVTALWPVQHAGRYRLSVVYAVPALTGGSVPTCPGLSAPASVSFTVGQAGGTGTTAIWQRPAVIIGAVVVAVLLMLLVVVLLVRRKGGGSPPAAKAAVMLTVALTVLAVGARPARASWDVFRPADVNFEKAVKDCFAKFDASGGDPAGIMKDIENPKTPKVTIRPVDQQGPSTTATPQSPSGPGSSTILFNKDSNFVHVDDGDIDACAELYHELFHAWEIMKGTDSTELCDDKGIQTDEVQASFAENQYRVAHGLKPRTTYGKKQLPKSLDECKQKPTPKKGPQPLCNGYQPGSSCAGANGDPHLTTFKQRRFDLQQVGEYVAVHADTGDLDIQTRQVPYSTSRTVSVNGAIAIRAGSDRLGFYVANGSIEVHRNGQVVDVPVGDTALSTGAKLTRRDSTGYAVANAYTVTWADGSTAWLDPIGIWGVRLLVSLAPARQGHVTGLFGRYDKDPSTVLLTRSGAALADKPSFDELYHQFGDAWRLTDAESLFDYAAGQNTQTFTDRSFPDRPVTTADLPKDSRDSAEAICRRQGVTDPGLLADCVLDVALTGSASFAINSQTTAAATGAASFSLTLSATSPGTVAWQTFPAIAGQKVFIEIDNSDVADSCGAVLLRDPSGSTIGSACVIGGRGYLDTVTLAVTGTYSLGLNPGAGRTGHAQITIVSVVDEHSQISVDGPSVLATVTVPGGISVLTFSGLANQKVYVRATGATLADQCGLLQLHDPTGSTLATGCVISAAGYIDAVVLPTTGQYSIVVNPEQANAGSVQITLTSAVDQQLSATIDGSAVTATIGQPGAVSRMTFSASAGTKVYLTATGSTMPDACGLISIHAPDGAALASGCVIGGGGYVDTTQLPVTGVYTVLVDPDADRTGHLDLRLSSVTDQHASLVVNGPPVTATISLAGAISVLSFAGTAGQQVTVDLSAGTLPDNCGAVWLRSPSGSNLNFGCLIGGTGTIKATTLPTTGTYAVVVDPVAATTGQVQIRVRT